ncbi:MAG: hypothetical protein M1814_004206 [Vezdaea aestivalis]|nr:MAG: hypothetical protein M1814_004206 [Vezdaea aestivalis]
MAVSSQSICRYTSFAEALHNVFVRITPVPVLLTSPLSRSYRRSFVTQRPKLSFNGSSNDTGTLSSPVSNGLGPNASSSPSKTDSSLFGPDLPSVVYDINITETVIDAIHPDGQYSSNVRLEDLRRRFNPFVYRLVQVAPATEASRMKCMVMDQESFIRYVVKNIPGRTNTNAATGAKGQGNKEIEMSWSITENDLEHKMKSLQEFLQKGKRIQINIAPKRRGRVPTPEEGDHLVAMIREKAAEVPSAHEWKNADGEMLRMFSMHFQGGPQPEESYSNDSGHSKRHEKKLRWMAQASDRTAAAAKAK